MTELLRDRYEVLEVAGHGGEGEVVKALDHQLDRVVALKIRTVGVDTDRAVLLSEARILLGMSPHPNLPLVREDFFDGDRYVIAMDWVEGIDLARVLQTRGRPGLAPTLVMNWLADAAAALAHLHTQDPPVVHGDVKPANLILGREGRVTLVDFGVSSTPGLSPRRSGTRGYIAPEASSGAAVNRAGDVYALAATAFALLSGAPPTGVLPEWEGIDPLLAAELEETLRVGLATDPARRPETPGELVERLRAGWTSTLPAGVLTFCATDIEGAAELWDRSPGEMARAVADYGALVAATVEQNGGRFVTSMADATVSVFTSPGAAVRAANSLATQVAALPASDGLQLRARIGLNTGEATGRDGDYSGPALHGAARARDLASGGEVLVSRATADVVRAHLPEGTALVDVGDHVYALTSDAGASPPAGTVCPYPGLVAFGASDAALFVGREAVIDDVITRLDADGFVALVGASGSGKSSLLRAGLAPRVPGAVVITPGAHPLDVYAKTNRDGLLVIDQFEETYTVCDDPDERITFINLLLQRPGPLILGIRADFYVRCATHPRLAVAVADHHMLLGPMTDAELRRAIVEPAQQVGLRLDAGLVDVMVAEVSGEAGGLPLLAHALRATWEARDGRALTLDAYRRTGGVHGAIARTADTVYESLDPVDQELARQLFLRLVEPGVGTEDTRRRANLQELTPQTEYPHQLRAVLTAQTDARLITVDSGTIELAHEALIREWPRLRTWLDEDRADITIRAHVTAAAEAWDARGRDTAELYRGPRLTDALDWLARAPQVSGKERAFIDASRDERDAGERAQLRANRRLRGLLAGTAIALVIALIGGGIAFAQRRTATDARERADVARIAALSRSLVQRQPDVGTLLAAEAYRRRATDDTRGTMLSALEAHPLMEGLLYGANSQLEAAVYTPDGKLLVTPTSDGSGTLLWDTRTRRRVAVLEHKKDVVLDAAISPDGRWLALPSAYVDDEGDYSGRLQIWDLRTRKSARVVASPAGPLSSAAFSADGRRLITQGAPQPSGPETLRVVVWNTHTWKPIGAPWKLADAYPDDGVVAVSRDGHVIAAPLSSSEVAVWNVDTRAPIGSPISLDENDVRALTLDANGRTLVVADFGSIRVFNTATGTPRRTGITLKGPTLSSIELSADGKMLAVGDIEGRTQLFSMTTGEALGPPLAASASFITDVSFSPDGLHLATASLDRTGALWRLDGSRAIGEVRAPQAGPVTEARYTPDGRTLVAGSTDGTVVITDAKTGTVRRTLHVDGEVRTIAIDRSGKQLAVGGTEDRVRVFDIATGAEREQLPIGDAVANEVAFDPTSDELAVALEAASDDGPANGRVIIWDAVRDRTVGDPIALADTTPFAVAWAPDGKQIAVSTDETFVHFYAAGAGHREIGKHIEGVDSPFYALAYSPDGSRLATGAHSGAVRQWSARNHKPVGPQLEGTIGIVAGIAYSPDGKLLAATTLGLSTTRLWNTSNGAPVGDQLTAGRTPFTDRTFTIDHLIGARPSFSPDGTHLATPSFDGATTVWDLSADHWLKAACDIVGRNLTRDEWRQNIGASGYRATCA